MKFNLNEIPIDGTSIESTKSKLINFLTNNETNQIITFNLDFLRISTLDDEFKNICRSAALVVPDGVGVTSLLKKKFKREFERITGNDLFLELLNISNNYQLKYAFVGASEDVQLKMLEKLAKKYPQIKDKILISPEKNFEQNKLLNDSIIEQLKEFKPDILFVALGCPRQEKWIFKHKNIIEAKISIGVGAAFDFFSEHRQRAPMLIQKMKLEWFWRLIIEPRRLFMRYIIHDLPFFINYLLQNKSK